MNSHNNAMAVVWAALLAVTGLFVLSIAVGTAGELYLVRPGPDVSELAGVVIAASSFAEISLMLALWIVAVVGALLFLMARQWKRSIVALALVAVPPLTLAAAAHLRNSARVAGFRSAAEVLEPVMNKLVKFEQEHGEPAASLAPLSADMRELIASAKPRACREPNYVVFRPPQAGSRWEFSMECGWRGWAQLDRFYYRPTQKYPHGPSHTPVGSWMYYWD